MTTQVVQYQSNLLTELIQSAESQTDLSEAEAEKLRQQVANADSERDIGELWAELDRDYHLLSEDCWDT